LFASLFYAEYQPATRMFRYVNAGHNPPIVLRPHDGGCEIFHLNPLSTPVGISSDAQFKTATFQLHIGDLLIVYTDGITEVQDRQGELWGQERFEQLLSACGGGTPKQVIEGIMEEVFGFAEGQPQRDDMTLNRRMRTRMYGGCAGKNRYGVVDERVTQGRRSEPPCPRVMRGQSQGCS
jgi:sigma-B regulation protein RsbU (phosphoserine phosphatase)